MSAWTGSKEREEGSAPVAPPTGAWMPLAYGFNTDPRQAPKEGPAGTTAHPSTKLKDNQKSLAS